MEKVQKKIPNIYKKIKLLILKKKQQPLYLYIKYKNIKLNLNQVGNLYSDLFICFLKKS